MPLLESLHRETRVFRLLPIALLLGGCFSGTETGTENTVVALEGQALLSNGKPAALATVMVRTGVLEVSDSGVPSWNLLSIDTADLQGRFRVRLPGHGELFLEIRQPNPGFVDPDSEPVFPEAFFARFEIGGAPPTDGPTYNLQPSGSLRGRLALASGNPPLGYWVGIRGSSILVPLESAQDGGGHPFTLDGVPAGRHALRVLYAGPLQASGENILSLDNTLERDVGPGTVTDMGTIPYDDNAVP